jgi:tyrosyl-tRNA synthetase
VPSAALPLPPDGLATLDVLDAFVQVGLVKSKGEARRLLEQGGLTVSGRRLSAAERALGDGDLLGGGHLLLRKGAREYAVARVL